ncbi:MAG: PASTA domain-containing protein [Chitinophagaceae bacterium]
MFQFITKKPLWANILFAIALVIVLLSLFFLSLNWITHHGKILRIPSVIGKNLPEAKKQLEGHGFDIVIQDSVYVDTIPPLNVVKQFPDADAEVKINRTVYLTINRAAAPLIQMPQLVGQSFRSAQILLKQTGLKLGDTSFVVDFAKNSIKKQLYNGQEIAFGTKIPMGAKIDLVISNGVADADMSVPQLVGMTYGDAKVLMESMSLEFGAVVFNPDVKDTTTAFIYRQSPPRVTEDKRVNRIRSGQLMDIWLSVEKPTIDSTAGLATPPPASKTDANNY